MVIFFISTFGLYGVDVDVGVGIVVALSPFLIYRLVKLHPNSFDFESNIFMLFSINAA